MTAASEDTRVWLYHPDSDPALFDNVRRRRMIAFLLDVIGTMFIWMFAAMVVFVLGIVTFSLGWMLFPILWPAIALIYTGVTLGGPKSATPGMAAMGLTMRVWHGERPDFILAVLHALFFYLSIVFLTPLILIVSLFSDRKRLLHDIALGVVVVNARPGLPGARHGDLPTRGSDANF